VRFVVAAGVLALLAAAPAAAITGGNALSGTLPLGHLVAGKNAVVQDKSRSCQAGKSAATKTAVLGSAHRTAVVACEQPPKSNLITPNSLAKATAAAIAALG